MPDLYEMEIGLNALDGADGSIITSAGYSQLELYLNGVASGAIDKSRYETEPYTAQEPEPAEPEGIREANGIPWTRAYDLQGTITSDPSHNVY